MLKTLLVTTLAFLPLLASAHGRTAAPSRNADGCPAGFWRVNETTCISQHHREGGWSTQLTIDPVTLKILDRDDYCRNVGSFITC